MLMKLCVTRSASPLNIYNCCLCQA